MIVNMETKDSGFENWNINADREEMDQDDSE